MPQELQEENGIQYKFEVYERIKQWLGNGDQNDDNTGDLYSSRMSYQVVFLFFSLRVDGVEGSCAISG